MENVVFVHRIDIGNKSPQRAKDDLTIYIEHCKIQLPGAHVQNVFIPIKNGNSTVECIYPVPGIVSPSLPTGLKFAKIRDVKSPIRGNSGDAGIDFFVPDDWTDPLETSKLSTHIKRLKPGEDILIPSGIKANVPKGYALIAFNKSGVATKKHLQVGACVVDHGYQGEIHLHLTNVSNSPQIIESGAKITQFILVPISGAMPIEVTEAELFSEESDRGANGFGSTGEK